MILLEASWRQKSTLCRSFRTWSIRSELSNQKEAIFISKQPIPTFCNCTPWRFQKSARSIKRQRCSMDIRTRRSFFQLLSNSRTPFSSNMQTMQKSSSTPRWERFGKDILNQKCFNIPVPTCSSNTQSLTDYFSLGAHNGLKHAVTKLRCQSSTFTKPSWMETITPVTSMHWVLALATFSWFRFWRRLRRWSLWSKLPRGMQFSAELSSFSNHLESTKFVVDGNWCKLLRMKRNSNQNSWSEKMKLNMDVFWMRLNEWMSFSLSELHHSNILTSWSMRVFHKTFSSDLETFWKETR